MTKLTNYIRFNQDGTFEGNIASWTYDYEISGEKFTSSHPDAPAFRVYAKSPRGRNVEVGGIWKKRNAQGGEYFNITIKSGEVDLKANLGRYPDQDDPDLMAIIPWS